MLLHWRLTVGMWDMRALSSPLSLILWAVASPHICSSVLNVWILTCVLENCLSFFLLQVRFVLSVFENSHWQKTWTLHIIPTMRLQITSQSWKFINFQPSPHFPYASAVIWMWVLFHRLLRLHSWSSASNNILEHFKGEACWRKWASRDNLSFSNSAPLLVRSGMLGCGGTRWEPHLWPIPKWTRQLLHLPPT